MMEEVKPCKHQSKEIWIGTALLILVKVDFRAKNITRDKEDHFTMIKCSIPQEDIAILNVYAPNKHSFDFLK